MDGLKGRGKLIVIGAIIILAVAADQVATKKAVATE